MSDRKLAEQMLGYSQRVVTKEAQVTPEEVQFLIDLMRTNAKVSRPLRWSRSLILVFSRKRAEIWD